MKSIIVILYMIFSTVHIFAENKIPHELILENPKAKITTIETKKEKEKSCLNLTVTKINSKNIDLDVNEENKIISCNLDENKVTTEKNDSIFFVKNISEIPTMTTINGVSHLNRLRNQSLFRATGVVNEDELTYNSKPILNNKNKKVINIEYKNQPKDLYMAIVNSKGEIKSVFKGNLKDKLLVDPAENKTINLQVWLFAGEINNNRNIVFSWANNDTGDIAIKPSDSSSDLSNINLQRGLKTVFNLSEAPVKREFQGTDEITGEGVKNIGAITLLKDNFYYEGKEGVKFSSKNYDYTAYIYNNFSGVVINLTKKGKIVPEIESFNLVQKNSKGELIQNIKITFYINSGTLKDHIPQTTATFSSNEIPDFWGKDGKSPINRIINMNCTGKQFIWKLNNFITDKLVNASKSPYQILTSNVGTLSSTNKNYKIPQVSEFTDTENGPINVTLTKASFELLTSYYSYIKNTIQTITFQPLTFTYGYGKRTIIPDFNYGVYNHIRSSIYDMYTTIENLPLMNTYISEQIMKNENVIYSQGNLINVYGYSQKEYKYINEENYSGPSIKNAKKIEPLTFTSKSGSVFELSNNKALQRGTLETFQIKPLKYMFNRNKEIMSFKISTIDETGFQNIYKGVITLNPFDTFNLYDKNISTINGDINRNVNIFVPLNDSDFDKDLKVNIGNVYFNKMNMRALYENGVDKNRRDLRMVLSNQCHLEYEGPSKIRIPIDLTFAPIGGDSGYVYSKEVYSKENGDNGASIMITIPRSYVKKLIQIKGRESNFELINDADNKDGILKIGFNQSINGAFWSKVLNNISFTFGILKSDNIKLDYNTKIRPLIKNPLVLKENSHYYLNNNSDINYNSNVNIIGEISPYTITETHKSEININGVVETNENFKSNSSWDIGLGSDNKIKMSYQNSNTIVELTHWSFKESLDRVIVKHYTYGNTRLTKYYSYNIKVPAFDPFVYYNENYNSNSIKINPTNLIVKRLRSRDEYKLGCVTLDNYKTKITKGIDDPIGLRIQGGKVWFINTKTNDEFDKPGDIYIEVNKNKIQELQGGTGKEVTGEVYIKLPIGLPLNQDYVVTSCLSSTQCEQLPVDSPENPKNYILAIGRNKFFKELIQTIKFPRQDYLEGTTTVQFLPVYPSGDFIEFNSIPQESDEKLTVLKGHDCVNTPENSGNGILTLKKGYTFTIFQHNGDIKKELLTSNSISPFNFTVNKNLKMTMKVENGNIALALNSWNFYNNVSDNDNNQITIEIRKGDLLICKHILIIKPPETFFRIINNNPMDFGSIIQGQKNNYAQGNISFITSPGAKVNVTLSNSNNEENINNIDIYSQRETHKGIKLKVRDITNSTISPRKNNYETNISGYLDVPPKQTMGNYKGNIIVNIKIKA